MEEIYQNAQSVKKEIIDIFVNLMEEDNIFKDNLSIEEIRSRLERNIDAVYIVDDAYRESVGGWYNTASRNIYIKAENPNELKEVLKSGNVEDILKESFERICHECIHALSPTGLVINDNISGSKGTAINEGLVQFFTNNILEKKYPNKMGYTSGIYHEQVDDTKALISVYGKTIIDAYFQGDAQNVYNDPITMAYVTNSDMKLTLAEISDAELALKGLPDKRELLDKIRVMHDGYKEKLMSEQGIDLFNLCKYGIPWPYRGTDLGDMIKSIMKFMKEDSNPFKDLLGRFIYRWHLSEQDGEIIWHIVQKEMEYYKTTTGKCIIVNSNNGNIIQVMSEGEYYGWYTEELKEDDEFCIEKDESGKYILKSYTTSVDGERKQLEVGLGRNFLDDTTQIDREIINQTSNLKISAIQRSMMDIEAIVKENKEEKDRDDE